MAELNEIAAGTMIGFSANKTVEEAKEDTATNRVDICKTKELYLNGERAGVTKSKSLRARIQDLESQLTLA